MLNLLLQSVLVLIGSIGFQAAPIAAAETLDDEWIEKTPIQSIEITEPSAAEPISKDTLAKLSNEDLYWVVAVLDGDTIMVSGANREVFQVRLLAVDTEEINGPDSSAECYGYEAMIFTNEFLKNRAVKLSADPANEDEDPYQRKLRYVDVLQADGDFLSLNEALLTGGYASFPEQYPVTNPEKFQAMEQAAKNANLGLWGMCSSS